MNLLSKLLAAEEPLFSLAVKQLEQTAGRPGQDVRLISEIIMKTHQVTRALGLDVQDTTGKELYRALINKMRIHDEHLARHIGGSDAADVSQLLPLLKRTVERVDVPRSAWVLKRSVAKKLLHENPPTKIMKHLGYVSAESMTKRENLAEIYGALRFVETSTWLKRFNKSYKQLTPMDFETRDIETVILDKERWGDLAEEYVRYRRHNITHLKELGVIVVLPLKFDRLPGITVTALSNMLHYMNEIRLYSAFFKLQQVKPGFGKIVAETLNADTHGTAIMSGARVHWRVVQHYYGQDEVDRHPEVFEPHIQPEDLHWRRTEEQLHRIDPELSFWKGLDYVGVMTSDGRAISLNFMDVAMNYTTQADYEHQVGLHLRGSLWNELFMRYMGHHVLEQQVLRQLDGGSIRPEKLQL